MSRKIWMTVALVAITLSGVTAYAQPLATADAGAGGVEWRPVRGDVGLVLTITGPEGFYHRQEAGPGESLLFSLFDAQGGDRPSGAYVYELRAVPHVDEATRAAIESAREAGGDATALRKAGKLPAVLEAQSGAFTVDGGAILMGGEEEARPTGGNRLATKDVVYNDDLIVTGSLCVGFDCVNGESFGFDTLRLKENNTRIKFEDTSASAGFPTTDWQLTANDSASGGLNKFSIEDVTGARVPFTIEGGSTTNSIYVDSTGRVGFRTATPVLDLHISTSNSPGMRLEQTSAGGFTAQSWDIAGNEANFFVRDVTGGSRLPLRIRPGAPTSSIDIAASGNVGIGTASPSQPLHLRRTDGSARLLIEDTNGGVIEMLQLDASAGAGGRPRLTFTNPDGDWFYETNGTNFDINRSGSGAPEELRLEADGDLIIGGTLTELSSRVTKEDFEALDPVDVLGRVADLPVLAWSYKTNQQRARHIGPMAEDFYQAFGLGEDDKHISPSDKAGVALLAIQGLTQVIEEKDARIEALERRLEALEKVGQGEVD